MNNVNLNFKILKGKHPDGSALSSGSSGEVFVTVCLTSVKVSLFSGSPRAVAEPGKHERRTIKHYNFSVYFINSIMGLVLTKLLFRLTSVDNSAGGTAILAFLSIDAV